MALSTFAGLAPFGWPVITAVGNLLRSCVVVVVVVVVAVVVELPTKQW